MTETKKRNYPKTRRPASDSVRGKLAQEAAAEKVYDVPEGLKALTKAEKVAWYQYGSAKNSWKLSELRTLHRIVKQETIVNKLVAEADKSPFLTEKINGDLVAHPIHHELRNAQKMLQAELRMVGLATGRQSDVIIAAEGATAKPGRGKSPVRLVK